MPNEDFSIKTGIEVDDSKVSQLKSIADELEKTAKALQKINNVKFNGDIFSGLTNAGKNIQNVTKEIAEVCQWCWKTIKQHWKRRRKYCFRKLNAVYIIRFNFY